MFSFTSSAKDQGETRTNGIIQDGISLNSQIALFSVQKFEILDIKQVSISTVRSVHDKNFTDKRLVYSGWMKYKPISTTRTVTRISNEVNTLCQQYSHVETQCILIQMNQWS